MAYDKNQILDATNGGLDIILMLYPDAQKAVGKNKSVHFKIRPNEKTASASLKNRDGIYYVTDFGGDQKARNAIDCWMMENGKSFSEAIVEIAGHFRISESGVSFTRKAEFSKRKKEENEKPGIKTFTKEIPDQEALKALGQHVTQEAFDRLGWKQVVQYEIIKQDIKEVTVVKATDNYFMYEINFDGFKKIYQPFNSDKKYRFMYVGERVKDYVSGLDKVQDRHLREESEFIANWKEEGDPPPFKLDKVIFCAGEKDALNVASLGYDVLWMNSETDIIKPDRMRTVQELCEEIYYLGDLDNTGQAMRHKWGLKYLFLRLMELPESLKTKRDWRGNPCKDVTDYLKHYSTSSFSYLFNTAYPYQFWEYKATQDKTGKIRTYKYVYNQAYALKFLEDHGFCRHKIPNTKTGYIFIRTIGNIVKEVEPVDIKAFLINFVKERRFKVDIVNLLLNSRYLSDNNLANLPLKEFKFKKADQGYQYMFFEKRCWKVTKSGIEEFSTSDVNTYVWEDEVIAPTVRGGHELRLKPTKPFFKITGSGNNRDIQILRQDNPFFQFLINTSRMHWKKEFDRAGIDYYLNNEEYAELGHNKIDNEELDADDIQEQKLHLMNKLHVIGYMLHTYKDPSKPWAVWAMDNRISEQTDSNGRSGKSITFGALRTMLKSEYENGRNKNLTEKPHLFENTTKHTDYLLVDDAGVYMDLNFWFAWITGDMPINPKHNKSFSIPFQESPKLAFTSNYAPAQSDSSTNSRFYFTVYSDFYHGLVDHHLLEKSPADDLGLRLFDDFTPDQWNEFFNLMAQCIQFYLSAPKMNPPMDNVRKRSLLLRMTDAFFNWANENIMHFVNDPETVRDDIKYIHRKAKLTEYKEYNPRAKTLNMNRFNKMVDYWCQFYGFEFNPEDFKNTQGRVFQKVDGEKIECFVIIAKDLTHKDLVEDPENEETPY